jgi:hypothetical protein
MELAFDQLQLWAADKDPEIVVGYPCSTHDCPMAKYLRHLDPEYHWCVSLGLCEDRPIYAVYYDEEGDPIETFELPEWARQVVRAVDREYQVRKRTAITAGLLLDILREIQAGAHEAISEPGGPRWR